MHLYNLTYIVCVLCAMFYVARVSKKNFQCMSIQWTIKFLSIYLARGHLDNQGGRGRGSNQPPSTGRQSALPPELLPPTVYLSSSATPPTPVKSAHFNSYLFMKETSPPASLQRGMFPLSKLTSFDMPHPPPPPLFTDGRADKLNSSGGGFHIKHSLQARA